MPRRVRLILLILAAAVASGCDQAPVTGDTATPPPAPPAAAAPAGEADPRPNILMIVVDDLGYSDLGAFGSEIPTPNIDALAADGVLLTNFHVAPTCSPTRAMLLSGTDNHIAGLGNMDEELAGNQKNRPGYEGHLNFRVAALPELLQDAGYRTYMTGKWHLGLSEETSPAARGFDRSFSMGQGGAGAFANMLPVVGPGIANYREDGRTVESLPDDFYATAFYTDRMIEYLDADREGGKPFFAYLAYTAPHWPLQAPQESIARHMGNYDDGYDVLRERRLNALKRAGLVREDVAAFPRFGGERPWTELSAEEQRYQAKVMAIYAAMVEDIDRYVGKLINYLKDTGAYDNTLVFFTSDNGPEGHHLEVGWDVLAEWVSACCDNSYENIGNADSYIWYGPNWGQAGNPPLRMFKAFTSQGGVQVPALFHFPARFTGGRRSAEVLTVKDVMPTLLELAGVAHPGPGLFRGRDVVAMQGRSLLGLLSGASSTVREPDDYMGWELFGKRGIRQGDWKIIYLPSHELREGTVPLASEDRWQLYHLGNDPAETRDVSREHPDKFAHMLRLWEDYATSNGVILPDWTSGY